jgi:Na+(H+)/acetate symporter ActP
MSDLARQQSDFQRAILTGDDAIWAEIPQGTACTSKWAAAGQNFTVREKAVRLGEVHGLQRVDALWPLVNPTVVSLPVGFLGAVLGTLMSTTTSGRAQTDPQRGR